MKWETKKQAIIGTVCLIIGAVLICSGIFKMQEGIRIAQNATPLDMTYYRQGREIFNFGKRLIWLGLTSILLTQPESFTFYTYLKTKEEPERKLKLWIGTLFVFSAIVCLVLFLVV